MRCGGHRHESIFALGSLAATLAWHTHSHLLIVLFDLASFACSISFASSPSFGVMFLPVASGLVRDIFQNTILAKRPWNAIAQPSLIADAWRTDRLHAPRPGF